MSAKPPIPLYLDSDLAGKEDVVHRNGFSCQIKDFRKEPVAGVDLLVLGPRDRAMILLLSAQCKAAGCTLTTSLFELNHAFNDFAGHRFEPLTEEDLGRLQQAGFVSKLRWL